MAEPQQPKGKRQSEINSRDHDMISEQEFTEQQHRAADAALPQNDSPGDSEQDTEAEVLLGLNYEPEEPESLDENEDGIAAAGREETDETANDDFERESPDEKIPESARVVSSPRPEPRADAHQNTSTH